MSEHERLACLAGVRQCPYPRRLSNRKLAVLPHATKGGIAYVDYGSVVVEFLRRRGGWDRVAIGRRDYPEYANLRFARAPFAPGKGD